MQVPEGAIRLSVSFTKSAPEMISALNFAAMPRAGDLVRTKNGAYRVKAIVHETNEAFTHDPSISVLLEPVDSFID